MFNMSYITDIRLSRGDIMFNIQRLEVDLEKNKYKSLSCNSLHSTTGILVLYWDCVGLAGGVVSPTPNNQSIVCSEIKGYIRGRTLLKSQGSSVSPFPFPGMLSSLLLIGLLLGLLWLGLRPRRPKGFPPGPTPLPVLGNLLNLSLSNPMKDFQRVS